MNTFFLNLLDEKNFFELHEELETIWLQENNPQLKLEIQGIIQLSVALFHKENNNQKGVNKLIKLASQKLKIKEQELQTENQVIQIIRYFLENKLKLD